MARPNNGKDNQEPPDHLPLGRGDVTPHRIPHTVLASVRENPETVPQPYGLERWPIRPITGFSSTSTTNSTTDVHHLTDHAHRVASWSSFDLY